MHSTHLLSHIHTHKCTLNPLPHTRTLTFCCSDAFTIIYNLAFGFESEAFSKQGVHYGQNNASLCVMSGGYLCGWCEESYGLDLNVREVFCKAKGDPFCKLVIAPAAKMFGVLEKFGWEAATTSSGPWGCSGTGSGIQTKGTRILPPLENLPPPSGAASPLTAKNHRKSGKLSNLCIFIL